MKLFGQLIRTGVNIALIPVALLKDVITLGGVSASRDESYTKELVRILKEEAEESDD